MKAKKFKKTFKIGIADDDQIFRTLLVAELCKKLNQKVAFCAHDGNELIKYNHSYNTDILIIDLYMPQISGIEAIKILKKIDCKSKIIAYSHTFQNDILMDLRKLKVEGYCKRDTAVINSCVDIILKDKNFIDQKYYIAWQNEVEDLIKSDTNLEKKLNATEIKLILFTCEGKNNKEIALELHLSKRTVDTYIAKLLNKLDLKYKSELIRFAYTNGICVLNCSNRTKKNCHLKSPFAID